MEKIIVLFAYLVNSVITILFALTIFGYKVDFKKVFLLSVLSGLFDYIIKDIVIPRYHLFDGLHILTGFIFIALLCRLMIRLNILGSMIISILSYILSGLGEFLIIIPLVTVFGLDFFNGFKDSKIIFSLLALLGTTSLLIPLVYLRMKNIQLIKLQISDDY